MVRRGVVVAVVGLALVGCGQETAAPSPSPSPPSAAELAARARQAGVPLELVHVTAADGYTLAAGGVGPYGEAGYQGIYADGDGDNLALTVERRTLDAATCPALPVPAAEPPGAPVRCTADGDGWARESGDRREYALVRDGLLVRVSGTGDAALVRAATLAARPATPAELDDLLPPGRGAPAERGDRPGTGAPVERGDLPGTGDGAPLNPTGPGG